LLIFVVSASAHRSTLAFLEEPVRELHVSAQRAPRLLGARSCYAANRDLLIVIDQTRVAPIASLVAGCDQVRHLRRAIFKIAGCCGSQFKNSGGDKYLLTS
jgi:hypothetical protein